jgi:hypothetical protein
VLLAISLSASVRAADPISRSTADSYPPDVWLINTRCLPCPRNQCSCSVEPRYDQLVDGRWVRSSVDTFLATTQSLHPLVFYVHGNRMAPQDAIAQGMKVYRRVACAGMPLRFVLWSWPSDRVHGAVRDAQLKAARSDGESYYLACLLNRLPSDTPVYLIGYSFGARTVTGSLHLLAGGTCCGNLLASNPDASRVRPRVTLLASAMPNSWISPTGKHGLAWLATDQILSFYNPKDPVLKLYQFTEQNGSSTALGRSGISLQCLGPYRDQMRQYRVDRVVGCSHDLDRYLGSPSIMNSVRKNVLGQEMP